MSVCIPPFAMMKYVKMPVNTLSHSQNVNGGLESV